MGISHPFPAQVAKLAKFFKVLRVLKFFKMNQDSPVGEMLEELTASKTLQAGFKFFSIIGRTAMLAHLMACFMAASGAGFLETYAPVRDDDDADSWGMMRRYLAGFYWAITTMSTVGYGDVTPRAAKESEIPNFKGSYLGRFHSFRLIFGRAIISRNGLEAWMLFPERARAEHSR